MILCLREENDETAHNKLSDETNVKYCNLKICKNYLIIKTIIFPKSFREMRQAVEEHKFKKQYSKNTLTEIKIELLITFMYKLMANLMTVDENDGNALIIHIKNPK